MKKKATIFKGLLFGMAILLSPKITSAQWFGPLTELDKAKIMVTYRMAYREDSLHLNSCQQEHMKLIIGNAMSVFQSYGTYEMARVGRQKQEQGILFEWIDSGAASICSSRYSFLIYKNYPKDRITTIDHVLFGDLFVYEESLAAMDWEILDDTMSIQGFSCQKAVCDFGGRRWEAWFSGELPFNDGPYKFNGLPGLILDVADMQEHYKFEFVSLETMPDDAIIGWEEQELIKTTKADFFKVVKASTNQTDYSDNTDNETGRRIARVLRSRNNPIELE